MPSQLCHHETNPCSTGVYCPRRYVISLKKAPPALFNFKAKNMSPNVLGDSFKYTF